MSRPRGFAARRPRPAARVLIRRAEQVLAEYEEHWPLTVRQIFYRLIAQHGYGKSKAFEHQLYDIMNRARRAGMTLFDAIRDDGGIIKYRPCWASLNALVSAVAHTATDFHLERQAGQPTRLFFWCEAAGMVPQLEQVAEPFDITVMLGEGFDSVTAKYEAARNITADPKAEILHVGDFDPSGEG